MQRNTTQHFRTFSSTETKRFAARFIKAFRAGKTSATVVALSGNLGSGKTTFVQGCTRGLGLRGAMRSPTFVLLQRRVVRTRGFRNLYHLDCYRIKKAQDMFRLGLREIIENPQNFVIIEWPEKLRRILPKETIQVILKHTKREHERAITIRTE